VPARTVIKERNRRRHESVKVLVDVRFINLFSVEYG
jgi:hypothetical protein